MRGRTLRLGPADAIRAPLTASTAAAASSSAAASCPRAAAAGTATRTAATAVTAAASGRRRRVEPVDARVGSRRDARTVATLKTRVRTQMYSWVQLKSIYFASRKRRISQTAHVARVSRATGDKSKGDVQRNAVLLLALRLAQSNLIESYCTRLLESIFLSVCLSFFRPVLDLTQ